MQITSPVSSLMVWSLDHRETSVLSQLVLGVSPLVITPTSNERIVAEGDAIRHQGISTYA
ncbi:MAG: hypothetical protein ACTHNU_13735 [Gaiellales bacterium]